LAQVAVFRIFSPPLGPIAHLRGFRTAAVMRPLAFLFHTWLQTGPHAPGAGPMLLRGLAGSSANLATRSHSEPHKPGIGVNSGRGVSPSVDLSSKIDALGEVDELPEYGDPNYWNDVYTVQPAPYDWLLSYCDIREFIENATMGNLAARILHVGCGSSELPEEMYMDGYWRMVNIDISPVAIDLMIERKAGKAGMQWAVMDATTMSFPDGEFDVVIEKSILDTLECNDDSESQRASYLAEVARVLRPGGAFCCVTLIEPSEIRPVLEAAFSPLQLHTWKLPMDPYTDVPFWVHAYVVRTPPGRATGDGGR